MRAKPNTAEPHNGEAPRETLQYVRLAKHGVQEVQNHRGRRIAREMEHHDPGIPVRRIVTHVGKTEVAGDKAKAVRLRILRDPLVAGSAKADVTNILSLVAVLTKQTDSPAGKIGIDEELHGAGPRD